MIHYRVGAKMALEILVYTILGPILDLRIILFSAQNTGTFTLSIKVDGDEINGGPLQLDYNNQTSSQPPHSMASPSHNHPTSPNRDHRDQSYKMNSFKMQLEWPY